MHPKIKILIIDDSKVFIETFIALLNSSIGNHIDKIDFTCSALSGLQIIKNQVYDYIFIDIDMPEINGIDFARQYNMDYYRRDTKLVAISFHEEPEYQFQMIKAGVFKYLLKDKIDYTVLSNVFESLT